MSSLEEGWTRGVSAAQTNLPSFAGTENPARPPHQRKREPKESRLTSKCMANPLERGHVL